MARSHTVHRVMKQGASSELRSNFEGDRAHRIQVKRRTQTMHRTETVTILSHYHRPRTVPICRAERTYVCGKQAMCSRETIAAEMKRTMDMASSTLRCARTDQLRPNKQSRNGTAALTSLSTVKGKADPLHRYVVVRTMHARLSWTSSSPFAVRCVRIKSHQWIKLSEAGGRRWTSREGWSKRRTERFG